MREFAGLRLREAGEEDVVTERCTEYYVSACRRTADGARYELVEWLAWKDLEADNIRSVLRRCLDRGDISRGMNLAASLRWFWYTRATTEGVRWLDAFLALGRGDPESQARADYVRGMLAVLLVDPAAAWAPLERATAALRTAGRLGPLVESLSMTSVAASMAGEREAARRLLDEARAVATETDDVGAALAVLQARAFAGLFERDLEAVRSASSEGEHLSREVGDLYGLKTWLMHLGMAALMAGDLGASRPLFAEALRIAHQIDDRVQQAYLLDALGCHAARIGNARLAAHLLGASATDQSGGRQSRDAVPGADDREAEESAIAALGAPKFAAELQVGRRLSRDAAVRLAIDEPARDAAAAPDDARRRWSAVDTRGRGRPAARGRPKQQGDRLAPVHLGAHRRQPRPQHPEQARRQLARPGRGLDGVVEPVADAEGGGRHRPEQRARPCRTRCHTGTEADAGRHESRIPSMSGPGALPSLGSMTRRPLTQRVEVSFVGIPPARQVERASGVSEVEVDGQILRCLVCGSFQPFLEALRGHEVVGLRTSPAAVRAQGTTTGDSE